jgi:hypothetical protein
MDSGIFCEADCINLDKMEKREVVIASPKGGAILYGQLKTFNS